MLKRFVLKSFLLGIIFLTVSCASNKIENSVIENSDEEKNELVPENDDSNEIDNKKSEEALETAVDFESEEQDSDDYFRYSFEVKENVAKHDYFARNFIHDNSSIQYVNDDRYYIRRGIDISSHDKNVNWKKVKKGGIEFVILRVGYRGYQTGILHLDKKFRKNIKGALKAGLDVGVYVFSQALSEEEAIEEAELCISELKNYEIQLPVCYDPESIPWEWARTDEITMEQVTKNTLAFCNRIKEAGYEPMIYSNLNWEIHYFDLEQLGEYKIWYADYREFPKTPYHFEYWQYGGESGHVLGVNRRCDVDIQILKNEKILTEEQLEEIIE